MICPYETIKLTTSDGISLVAWYVAPPSDNDGVIIYLHGVESSRDACLPEAKFLYTHHYGALLLDMRGHGDSDKSKATYGVKEIQDVHTAWNFLKSQSEINTEKILLFGKSLGASTALLAAADIPEIKGVIGLSPYSSFADVIGDRAWLQFYLPPRPSADMIIFLASLFTRENLYKANPRSVIANIAPRPILLMHGKLDTTTPVINSKRLFLLSNNNIDLWLVENLGHGGFYSEYPKEYERRILMFLRNFT